MAMIGLKRTVALVGMMGAGKSSLGRRLAGRLDVTFRDADTEIETAAGCSINEIFARFGEPAFRDGERKVIARLLGLPPHVLATGGGAFADSQTRQRIKEQAVSIWINVPLELLIERVGRRDTRPMLKDGDPAEIMARLYREREPLYAQADITINSEDVPHKSTIENIIGQLRERDLLEEA
jgi:shikimate kinase